MQDFVTYLTTAATSLPGIQGAIFILTGMVGFISVGFSLIHQVSEGRRGEAPLPATIAGLVFGSLMLSLSTVVNITSASFFGAAADPRIISSYTPVGGDNVRIATQAIVSFINVIGWAAAARGLWRWRIGPKYDQPGWFYSGLVFLLAGSACTNLYVFADMLAVTVGAIPVGTNYFKF